MIFNLSLFPYSTSERIHSLCGNRKEREKPQFNNSSLRFMRKAKRINAFNRDFPAFINSYSSSLRIGADHITSFRKTAELFPEESVMRQEINQVIMSLNSGKKEEEAINQFGAFTNSLDVRLFCSLLILSMNYGSSITVGLRRLLKVVRQRQVFNKKIKAVLALQKLSAIGILLCFLSIITSQIVFNTDAVIETYKSELGFKMLCTGGLLLVGGTVWMFHLAGRKY